MYLDSWCDLRDTLLIHLLFANRSIFNRVSCHCRAC